MQWNHEENAGFGKKIAGNALNQNYKEGVNVLDQMKDPWSIINFFQYAILKRREPDINDIVLHGKLHILDFNHPDVLAYMHEGKENLVVIASLRPYETYFSFYHMIRDVVLHNYGDVLLKDHVFTLRPFECFLLKV